MGRQGRIMEGLGLGARILQRAPSGPVVLIAIPIPPRPIFITLFFRFSSDTPYNRVSRYKILENRGPPVGTGTSIGNESPLGPWAPAPLARSVIRPCMACIRHAPDFDTPLAAPCVSSL